MKIVGTYVKTQVHFILLIATHVAWQQYKRTNCHFFHGNSFDAILLNVTYVAEYKQNSLFNSRNNTYMNMPQYYITWTLSSLITSFPSLRWEKASFRDHNASCFCVSVCVRISHFNFQTQVEQVLQKAV